MSLSTIFQLYWWRKPECPKKPAVLSQVTDEILVLSDWCLTNMAVITEQSSAYDSMGNICKQRFPIFKPNHSANETYGIYLPN